MPPRAIVTGRTTIPMSAMVARRNVDQLLVKSVALDETIEGRMLGSGVGTRHPFLAAWSASQHRSPERPEGHDDDAEPEPGEESRDDVRGGVGGFIARHHDHPKRLRMASAKSSTNDATTSRKITEAATS
jgi:hypothetical protein